MKAVKLEPYQIKAIDAIKDALDSGKRHMAIEMPVGCGKELVFAKTIEKINETNLQKILVVTYGRNVKENLERELSTNYKGFIHIDQANIVVETLKKVVTYHSEKMCEYACVIFYDIVASPEEYETISWKDKVVIAFNTTGSELSNKRFLPIEVVFSYSIKDAVYDGFLTPAMDTGALGPAVEIFTKNLLEQFGYEQINGQEQIWDVVAEKQNKKIWVECKSYRSQTVSPSAANSMLQTVVMRKIKQHIPQEDVILLVVLSKIPSFEKDVIFDRHRIVVLDIENLVFYSKSNHALLKQLSQITYYPIDYVEGKSSEEAERAGLFSGSIEANLVDEVDEETNRIDELIQQLRDCESGRAHSSEYEKLCELIIRTLFEANYFNRLTSQHKTKDEHFRMDLIGSLKINQKNEESMHPLWQMFVQHYNSHFVVFEFKNYSEEVDQNLIYITEKYLFDAALRNVAIIISRKGFSDSAKFAAEGCLKEHGKLILSITDKDLIEMLKVRSDEAADYLLKKLEEFLMGISK